MNSASLSEDTIVAVATPPGRGAIALVRVSGMRAFELARLHVKPWPKKLRTASLCEITNGDEVLDHALVTLFGAPDSFTGEDIVEISTHGGHVVPLTVAAALIRSGAREATRGEFTRRAVLNGKLDLVQAEGLGELIAATSDAMRRAALNQLQGGLTRMLSALRSDFLTLEAQIAYEIDFPEEDDGPVDRIAIARLVSCLEEKLARLLSTKSLGGVIREGAVVVIAGPPNCGKSSLFNALLGTARAIVTDIPGTTRDAIEAVIDAGEWPLRLVDTAGLRETADQVERLGIEISERYLSSADVVLACAESPDDLARTASKVNQLTATPVICVRMKADIASDSGVSIPGMDEVVSVSAEARTGLDELIGRITASLRASYGSRDAESPLLTTARQSSAIDRSAEELRSFSTAWSEGKVPATIAAVHLREAVRILEDLIGGVTVDDVLDRLFSTFCIGK